MRSAIYQVVRRIPRGRVLSYGDIGRIVGTSARQVAAAMRNCPSGLPWHRVVGAGGKIRTLGETAIVQKELLSTEGIRFRGSGFSYRAYHWRADERRGKSAN